MAGKNKSELTAEALGLGIDLPEGSSNKEIQELIDQKLEAMAATVMSADTLLGAAPRAGRFIGGRGDQ